MIEGFHFLELCTIFFVAKLSEGFFISVFALSTIFLFAIESFFVEGISFFETTSLVLSFCFFKSLEIFCSTFVTSVFSVLVKGFNDLVLLVTATKFCLFLK